MTFRKHRIDIQKVKINILNYLCKNQDKEYVSTETLHKALKKASFENIVLACERLISEGLVFRDSTITEGDNKTGISIKIALDGICFLREHESFVTNKRSNSINLWTLIITALSIFSGIILAVNFDKIFPKSIDNVTIKITNEATETIVFNKSNNLFLWLPSLDGAPYIDGKYEFISTDEYIEVLPGESVYLKAKILNNDKFYGFYLNGDCDIDLWITTNLGLTKSQKMRFAKDCITVYYFEFTIS